MANWLELETTTAPNPTLGRDPLRLKVAPELYSHPVGTRRETPIFQLWCHVYKELPPINNIGKVRDAAEPPTLTTLHDSVACFSGIKRPHNDEPTGGSVLVYVLNPKVSIEWHASYVCVARPVPLLSNTVMTVHVRPHAPLQAHSDDGIHGLITRIEPVFGDPRDARLPRGYDTRYDRKHWVK